MPSLAEAIQKLEDAIEQLKYINGSVTTVNASITDEVVPRIDDTNDRLDFEIKQNTAMICNLEKITKQTCALVNEAVQQTAAQRAIQQDTRVMRQLYELANPEAAVEQNRLDELKRQVEKCCPPPKAEQPCRYEPCKDPGKAPTPRPRGKDKDKDKDKGPR